MMRWCLFERSAVLDMDGRSLLYPNEVFAYPTFGLAVVLCSSSKATFSNSGARLPLVCQPREPPDEDEHVHIIYLAKNLPCLALSSEYSLATSSNFTPPLIFVRASSILECFSHCKINLWSCDNIMQKPTRICRTLIDCAPFWALLLAPASSASFGFLPPLFFGGIMLVDQSDSTQIV